MTLKRFFNLAAIFGEITLSRLFAPAKRIGLPPQAKPNIRSIALFCYMGLGDAVMALPMIRALKAAFPTARLECICSQRTAAYHALSLANVIDEFHPYEFKDSSLLKRWRMNTTLRAKKFDLAIGTYTAPIEHFVPFLLSVPHRVGHQYTDRTASNQRPDWLFHYPALIANNEHIHETERYRRIVQAIMPDAAMPVSEVTQRFFEGNEIVKNAANGTVIGIHAAVSPSLAWKNWGKDRFVAVCKRCIAELNAHIRLFGDASERASLLAMAEEIGAANVRVITPLPEQRTDDATTLRQTSEELMQCDILLGNESGIGHVAMSLGIPTIRIFGMTDYHGVRALDTQKHTDIRKDLPCSPCFVLGKVQSEYNLHTCGHRNCLASISVDEVFEAVQRTLHRIQAS
jgi:heptosyltransferase-2